MKIIQQIFKKFHSLWRWIGMLGIGLVGGIIGTLLITNTNITNNQITKTETGKVVYNNSNSTTEAIKKVQNAVVSVINYKKQSSNSNASDFYSYFFGDETQQSNQNSTDNGLTIYGEGSGVIYKKSGKYAYLVTNNHVVSGADQLEIQLADGTKTVGKLIGADTYSDLAVVRIDADKVSSVAEFADSNSLKVGETAIAIGSPLGTEYANSVTQGIVSSLSRTVTMTNEEGETISTNAIQTDAAINPGNSGGALINIEGQVIGINSSKISSTQSSSEGSVEGMGFAIPSNDVVKIINQLESKKQVVRPALGISMASLNSLSTSSVNELGLPKDVTSGIVVAAVQKNMPASGKLEKYDVITEVDGKEVSSVSDLQSALYGHNVNDSVKITFYRKNEKKTVTITLSKTTQDLKSSN